VDDVSCLYDHSLCGPVIIVSSAAGSICFHLFRKSAICVMTLVRYWFSFLIEPCFWILYGLWLVFGGDAWPTFSNSALVLLISRRFCLSFFRWTHCMPAVLLGRGRVLSSDALIAVSGSERSSSLVACVLEVWWSVSESSSVVSV
jgi:hypothetical protein